MEGAYLNIKIVDINGFKKGDFGRSKTNFFAVIKLNDII